MALVSVVVLTVLAGGFLQVARSIGTRQHRVSDIKQAFYLAEAGLAEAYMGLAVAKSGNLGSAAAPAQLGSGLVWVEATEYPSGLVELESTGMSGGGRATLGLVVEPVDIDLSVIQPIFSEGSVTLPAGSYVDSYDSSQGDYATQLAAGTTLDPEAVVFGTNGDFETERDPLNPTEVHGAVAYGNEAEFKDPAGAITGAASASANASELAPMPFPTDLKLSTTLTHDSPIPLVISAGTNEFEQLRVAAGSEVLVLGPGQFLTGSVVLDSGSNLTFDTGAGPVQWFVRDTLEVGAGATIANLLEDPSALALSLTGADPLSGTVANLVGLGPFHGSIYAPAGTVAVDATFEVFGSLRTAKLAPGSALRLHVDRYLQTLAGQANLPELQAWRVVEIPPGLTASGANPIALLGLDPSALVPLSASHKDQELSVIYTDDAGVDRVYEGPESQFDWTDVSSVLAANRDGTPVPGATSAAAAEAPPAPVDPDDLPLIDVLTDPFLTSDEVKDRLLAEIPLSANILMDAIRRDPPLVSLHLLDVLRGSAEVNGLPASVLKLAVGSTNLTSEHLRELLTSSSPLPNSVLNELVARTPPMNQPDLDAVLAAQ